MNRSRLLKEIDDWAGRGLIDAAIAERLANDVKTRVGGFSFASVLGLLASLLLGAAILTFIAANWESVPRLGRLGLIGALIAAGPLIGAVLEARGARLAGEGARIVGSAAYGAGIALVSQMYHISGDEASGVLFWCVGTAVAAALTRSKALTIAAILLAAAFLSMKTNLFGISPGFPWWYPALLAVLWALAIWTDSIGARRLVVLALIHFGLHLWIDSSSSNGMIVALAILGLSVVMFALSVLRPVETETALKLGGASGFLAMGGFASALFMLHWHFGDAVGGMLVVGLIGLGGAIGALWSAGGHDRLVRISAYVMFTVEVILVYFITVGGLIGTAAFFLSAGVALALAAFIILRLEKRVAARASEASR